MNLENFLMKNRLKGDLAIRIINLLNENDITYSEADEIIDIVAGTLTAKRETLEYDTYEQYRERAKQMNTDDIVVSYMKPIDWDSIA